MTHALFRLVIGTIVAAILIASASAHDPDGDDAFHDWFVAQLQPSGIRCCGLLSALGGDAHYVEARADGEGGYLVKVEGHWMRYPGTVDPYILNPTGRNVAWYDGSWPNITWYCLRLAGGS